MTSQHTRLNDRLEGLREMLYEPPSRPSWRGLCRALDDWPVGEGLELGLEYAREVLRGWPDALRMAPLRWLTGWIETGDEPRLTIVRGMRFTKRLFYDQIARIAEMEHLSDCTILGFFGNRLSDKGLEVLLGSPHLSRIAELELSNNTLRDAGLEALRDKGPEALVSLDLSFNLFDSEGLGALLGSERCSRVSRLTLSRNARLGRGGVEAIVGGQCRLTSLGLKRCGIDDGGLALLAEGDTLSRVTHLDLSNNRITDEGIGALVRSPAVAALEVLDVGDNGIHNQGWHDIAGSEHLGSLRSLKGFVSWTIRGNRIGEPARTALLESPHLSMTLKKRLRRRFEHLG